MGAPLQPGMFDRPGSASTVRARPKRPRRAPAPVLADKPAPAAVRVLGVDLGSSTGYALLDNTGRPLRFAERGDAWGVLHVGRYPDEPTRWARSLDRIRGLVKAWAPTHLAYEEVRRHEGVHAAHVYGALRAALWAGVYDAYIATANVILVEVADAKRTATGRGGASKDEMLAAARRRWPQAEVRDHNLADALWIAEYARRAVANKQRG